MSLSASRAPQQFSPSSRMLATSRAKSSGGMSANALRPAGCTGTRTAAPRPLPLPGPGPLPGAVVGDPPLTSSRRPPGTPQRWPRRPGLGEDRLHRLCFVHFAALWAADQRHQQIASAVAECRQPVLRKVSPDGQRALQFLSHQLQRVGLKGVPVGHHTSLTGLVWPMRHAHRMTQTD